MYALIIKVVCLWNPKAKAWLDGRSRWFEKLQKQFPKGSSVIWIHCSSAGEFEQGKPVIEALRINYPDHKILVSFFSPSGMAAAKNYSYADYLIYLPLDTKKNAAQFIYHLQPALVIFVKYEFWYHYLNTIAHQKIPLYLASASFRKEQIFFKWYGGFFKKMLFFFTHLFVQDQPSLSLLKSIGLTNCSIGGDTRFDRVNEISQQLVDFPLLKEFCSDKQILVAGSTWPGDEALLAGYMTINPKIKLIIAPHEINTTHLQHIGTAFPGCLFYSKQPAGSLDLANASVLVIDTIGLLSRLYAYATVTYVGGGFTKDGIHNILEAAVWGKPVIFGPNYKKYREASELIANGGGFSIKNKEGLSLLMPVLLSKENTAGTKALQYIEDNTGATTKILQLIKQSVF